MNDPDVVALHEEILLLKELLVICSKRLDEYEREGYFLCSDGHEQLIGIIRDVV